MRHDPEAHADRPAELLGGALRGTLSAQEEREFDALRAADPSVEADLADLHRTLDRVRAHRAAWDESAPPAALRDAVLAIPFAEPGEPSATRPAAAGPLTPPEDAGHETPPPSAHPQRPPAAGHPAGRRRRMGRRAAMLLATAASFAAGLAVALGAGALADRPPDGPPGTLGAEEAVDFEDGSSGLRVEGVLIAHTWGTETVLELDGLPAGETFEVLLVGQDGADVDSGTFIGSAEEIDCRMNGALLREDVQRVEIRDESGSVMASATLPEADPPQ